MMKRLFSIVLVVLGRPRVKARSLASIDTVMGGSAPKVRSSVVPDQCLGYNDLAQLHKRLTDQHAAAKVELPT